MSEGFVYVACGKKYVDESIRSAESLRRVDPKSKICLVTDQLLESEVFDKIVIHLPEMEVNDWKRGFPVQKILKNSLCRPVSELFGLLNHFDLLFCHDYYDKSEIDFEGQLVESLRPINTGVIGYRNSSSVSQFMENWTSIFQGNLDRMWSDQPAFMEALLQCDLRSWTLPSTYNFRFPNHLAIPHDSAVKIIHGRASLDDFKWLENKLNKDLSQRSWDATARKIHSWNDKNPLKFLYWLYGKFRTKRSS
jgi:hypothetical protein